MSVSAVWQDIMRDTGSCTECTIIRRQWMSHSFKEKKRKQVLKGRGCHIGHIMGFFKNLNWCCTRKVKHVLVWIQDLTGCGLVVTNNLFKAERRGNYGPCIEQRTNVTDGYWHCGITGDGAERLKAGLTLFEPGNHGPVTHYWCILPTFGLLWN